MSRPPVGFVAPWVTWPVSSCAYYDCGAGRHTELVPDQSGGTREVMRRYCAMHCALRAYQIEVGNAALHGPASAVVP